MSAHDYYLTLKARASAAGLTAVEWNWYRIHQKEFEPEVLAAERTAAERSNAMKSARKLSVEDLTAILDEKTAAIPPAKQKPHLTHQLN